MKVAFLTYSFYSGGLGTLSHVVPLVRELRRLGVDVDVFSFSFHSPVIGIGLCTLSSGLRRLNKYDVIHSQEGVGFFIRQKNLVVFVAHVPSQEQGILDNLEFKVAIKKVCMKGKRIITPSIYTKHRLIENGVPDGKIMVIHHGINHNIFKPDPRLRIAMREKYGLHGFIAITVGSMTRRKNQKDILKALSQINDVTLILVGNGPERTNLLKMAKKLPFKTLYFDYVPKKELVGLYNAADVYLHTALVEGFGFPVLEALSCGIPVIAYRTADFDYIIKDGGFVIKKGDIKELRDKILYIRENECERKKLGNNAFIQSKKFSWTKAARKYIRVYKETMQ